MAVSWHIVPLSSLNYTLSGTTTSCGFTLPSLLVENPCRESGQESCSTYNVDPLLVVGHPLPPPMGRQEALESSRDLASFWAAPRLRSRYPSPVTNEAVCHARLFKQTQRCFQMQSKYLTQIFPSFFSLSPLCTPNPLPSAPPPLPPPKQED